jgi:hypothetical protein
MFDFSSEFRTFRGPAGTAVTLRHNLPFNTDPADGFVLTPSLTVTAAFLGFAFMNIFVFLTSTLVSSMKTPGLMRHFRKASWANKIDFTTRTTSFLHSFVVIFVLCTQLPQLDWSTFPTNLPAGVSTVLILRHSLCFSCGYFASDCIAIVVSLMEMWPLYLFHHITSMTALIAVVFGGCDAYLVPCACFFIVEWTTFSLQTVFWLEFFHLHKRGVGRQVCGAARHATFWLWMASRNVPPAFLTYTAFVKAMNPEPSQPPFCAWPCVGAGVGIMLFCWGVFFGAILPSYLKPLPAAGGDELARKVD